MMSLPRTTFRGLMKLVAVFAWVFALIRSMVTEDGLTYWLLIVAGVATLRVSRTLKICRSRDRALNVWQ